MYTLSCRNKHIQAIQCLHGQLGSTLATALATGRGDTSCLVKRVGIIRAYLRILYCHWVPTTEIKHMWTITITGLTEIGWIINMDTEISFARYNSIFENPADTAAAIAGVFAMFDAVDGVDGEVINGVIYLWADTPLFTLTTNSALVELSDLSTSIEDYLLTKNCLTDLQINDIITSSYKVLETESGCGCS